jgi:hypothetical protein
MQREEVRGIPPARCRFRHAEDLDELAEQFRVGKGAEGERGFFRRPCDAERGGSGKWHPQTLPRPAHYPVRYAGGFGVASGETPFCRRRDGVPAEVIG